MSLRSVLMGLGPNSANWGLSVRLPWLLLGLLVATSSVGMIVLAPGNTATVRPGSSAGGPSTRTPNRTVHYVTPDQLAGTNALIAQETGGLSAPDQEGRRRDWSELSRGRPVVLVFVKEGCPCNVEFEPHFQAVARLYRGMVQFADVIDADVEGAARYASEQHMPYPVLADPERSIIRRFRAENGGYVILLDRDARIESYWPGCSAETLRDLSARIARLVGVQARDLDTSGMARALVTGCPYEHVRPRETTAATRTSEVPSLQRPPIAGDPRR